MCLLLLLEGCGQLHRSERVDGGGGLRMSKPTELVYCHDCVFWAKGVIPHIFKGGVNMWFCVRRSPSMVKLPDGEYSAAWPVTGSGHYCGDGVYTREENEV